MNPGTCEGGVTIRIASPTIARASGTSIGAFAGSRFWARTITAITTIHVTLMTISATNINISPMLEPAQQSPYSNPEPRLSRHRRRKSRLSGVSSYRPAVTPTRPATRDACGWYSANTAKPTSVQTARYDPTKSGTVRTPPAWARLRIAGAAPGSIIAAIIETQSATKNANEPSGVATPISIPFICPVTCPFISRTAKTQDAAASPSVAASAAAVGAVLGPQGAVALWFTSIPPLPTAPTNC